MKILVTGGTGSVGRSVVARLIRNGNEVKVIGRRTDIVIEGGDYQSCDITDFPSLREQVKGMDAVVHLAAIPSPRGAGGHEIFRVNSHTGDRKSICPVNTLRIEMDPLVLIQFLVIDNINVQFISHPENAFLFHDIFG